MLRGGGTPYTLITSTWTQSIHVTVTDRGQSNITNPSHLESMVDFAVWDAHPWIPVLFLDSKLLPHFSVDKTFQLVLMCGT